MCVYVDDLLVTDACLQSIMEFKREMRSKFEMSDLGKLTYYLGIEVCQLEGSIVLSQDKYAQKFLEETCMHDCNLTHIPMELNLRLSKLPQERSIDERQCIRSIGCLRYLLHTKPGLSFSVGVLNRYMQDPKESYGAALKQVLR